MKKEKDIDQETYSSMVNANSMLLSFEGWVKYIEGFTKGLSSTKQVDSVVVLDCVGEILEYMQQLRGQLYNLLVHCEKTLEKDEQLELKIKELEEQIKLLLQPKLGEINGKEM